METYLAGELPEFIVKSEYFRIKGKKVRLGLRGFAKDKEFSEGQTCLLMFLLGLTSPWGLICCKMGQLSQRQQQREQNLLLDQENTVREFWSAAEGAGTEGVQLYELHQSDQEN